MTTAEQPTTLFLDVFSGLSGDMLLGALIDLGVSLPRLEAELATLEVSGYHLHARRDRKSGIEGVKFDVHLEPPHEHEHGHEHGHEHEPEHGHGHEQEHTHPRAHDQGHGHHHPHRHARERGARPGHHGRTYADIRRLIDRSPLTAWVKARSIATFHRLAVAEGKIHGHPPEEVHFHEVGAVDSIVDIVGACIALDLLGRPEVLAGPVVEGTGFVKCAHGRMPLPAPATLEILAARGIAVSQCDEPHEMVTPTGAALLAEFATGFGPLDAFLPRQVGYGLGTRDHHTRPNVVRAVLGERTPGGAPGAAPDLGRDWECDTVAVLETNLDDASPEVLGDFLGRALTAGALDVFHTPIQMKKGRPGVLLTVLCAAEQANRFSEMILTETSAFGVRETTASRRKLRREFQTVSTPLGQVTVKIGRLRDRVVQAAPEFESCRLLAESSGVPVRTVLEAAAAAARALK